MALIHHRDHQVRFNQQVENAREYVLPFIEETKPVEKGTRVLEVGTGEGGVLVPFADKGAFCVGVDLNPFRIDLANEFLADRVAKGEMEFILQNIYEQEFLDRFKEYFDIIILKDVIEHVPEQEKFIPYLKKLLRPGGQIFFGFPPWYMPFGGHQQVCRRKWASVLPYYHILPKPLYRGILKLAGEDKAVIDELMEIWDTQITMERFERIVRRSGMKIHNKQPYLINPIYRYKFGLKPRRQFGIINAVPYVRDFFTTCAYYTIG